MMRNAESYPYLVIDDFNAHHFTAGGSLAGSTGYKGWQRPGAAHAFQGKRPLGQTIPRSQWHERIKAGQGTFLSDLLKQKGIKAKDQNGRSLCWCYGSVRAIETARAICGLPTLDLSPESVAGPCTHWRDEGGYAAEAFQQLQNAGACESSFMDRPYSLSPSRWKTGWQENAQLHEAIQWAEIDTRFDEVITCLLERIPVAAGLDWWGHLVCFLDPVILPDGSVGVLFQNSWGENWPTPGANGFATLTERKATPDGAAAPIIVTASDA